MMAIWRTHDRTGSESGSILPGVLAFMIAVTIIGGAVLTVIIDNLFVSTNNVRSQQAFNIAEAGVNYYMWILEHDGTDYQDGTGAPSTQGTLGYGPYVHQYIDSNLVNQGTYTLWVKPPTNGSTIVTVTSIGQASGSSITRTVQAQVGDASFASYGLVSNTAAWFGNDESSDGPVFDNQGIRMDGSSDDTVGSANATYVPSAELGGDGSTSEPGVWCSSTVVSPINCSTRNKSDWIYPEPSVNFNQVATSLCTMKKTAFDDYSTTSSYDSMSSPCSQLPTTRTNAYIPERSTTFSTTKGYLIQLNTNGTYNLDDVNADNDENTPYTSALSLTTVATNLSLPPSGVIFVEDNVWVMSNPTFAGRVTIASGRLASTTQTTNITIAGPVVYTTENGSDSIGMVSQGNVYIAPYAPPATGSFNFQVDGALLAESGSVTYPYTYIENSNLCTRGWTNSNQTLTFYGSVASMQTWTWNWQGGACGNMVYDPTSGYYFAGIENTNTDYDYNMLYSPPPDYPVTGSYQILNWREVLTKP